MPELRVAGVDEAAAIIGVSRITIWRYVQDGILVPDAELKCGSIFRVSQVERVKKRRERKAQGNGPAS